MDIWQKGRILYETRNVMVVKMIHRGYCLQTDNVPLVKTEDFNASTDQNNLYSKKIMKNFFNATFSHDISGGLAFVTLNHSYYSWAFL